MCSFWAISESAQHPGPENLRLHLPDPVCLMMIEVIQIRFEETMKRYSNAK